MAFSSAPPTRLRSFALAPMLAAVLAVSGCPTPALAQQLNGQATGSAQAPRDQMLTTDQVREEFGLVRKAMETMHPGYDRYTDASTLAAMWAAAEAETIAKPTRGNLYLEVSRALAAIRCDHTKAELPTDFENSRKSEALYLPFRFVIFDKRMFVTNPGSTDLVLGEEVTAIDGTPTREIIEAVFELFPVDGDTDHIKGESVSEFGEFMGPAFEHFYPFLYEAKGKAELTLVGGGETRSLSVERLNYTDYAAITGQKRFSANFVDAVNLRMLDDTTAYLSVDTFINYRKPISPDKIYKPIFQALEASGRDTLILDLRRNGGGSNDAQMGLLKWLMPSEFQQASAVLVKSIGVDKTLKPHLSSWNKAALKPNPEWFKKRPDGMFEVVNRWAGKPADSIKAKKGAFTGRLIVLTSSDNASGVTHLLSVLRTQREATFVGEKTGGAATGATAGILAFLTLPHSKVKVRVPLQRTVIAKAETLDPRGGITPDILAPDTRASRLAGIDPAMEAAIKLAQSGA